MFAFARHSESLVELCPIVRGNIRGARTSGSRLHGFYTIVSESAVGR